ncbi:MULTISPECIES: UDP-2,3-diacylglucosamine diphosphatase [Halomonadaceae]|uniref:UDP-2,3-diacylglucosamine diphosphatase n=1 Tax=Halomonadaceae TaxID=28256 RepID=UPI001599155F|nr:MULTISPECIES: UDP-2,3-diacylglucosamine diphosphatase [Halomonas]QJQ94369.1 UDP-2,3-diacylglucosamine diphosphatase [Halomonas sp. PA5]
MSTLFIADLHLYPEAPEFTDAFLAYIEEQACNSEALYILGDFFETWIGDDILDLAGADPTGNAALAELTSTALKRLSESGTRIYLMHGNRDFLLGERFAEACGATLIEEPQVIEVGAERLLLMHGDTLCTRDEAYQAFRLQARNPQWQAQILSMPIEQRIELAKSLRMQSGEAISNKSQDIMDVTPEEVVRVMAEHGVTTLIHGHTHRPAVHELTVNGAAAKRYVLGDWQARGWELRADRQGSLHLRDFPIA